MAQECDSRVELTDANLSGETDASSDRAHVRGTSCVDTTREERARSVVGERNGFGLVVGSFLLAIGILFIYQVAQHDYYKPLFKSAHIDDSQILVADDGQYMLDNLTSLNVSNHLESYWTPSVYDYEYSSVREGERYAGPSLAVLGAIVFLLSLSLCMWLKISGKIIVLQPQSRLLSMEDSGYSGGTVVLGSVANGEVIPLETFSNSTPSPTALRASRSPRRAHYSPVPSPARSPRHMTPMTTSPMMSHARPVIPSYEQISREQTPTPSTTPHLCRHHRRVQSSLAGTSSAAASPLFGRPMSSPLAAQRQSSLRIPASSSAAAASPAHPLRATLPPNAPPPAYADVFPN